MKGLFFLLVFISVLVCSCKSDSKASNSEEKMIQSELLSTSETLSGEFIHSDSVGVFKKRDDIYGVVMNTKAKELIAEVQKLDNDPYASFDVVINAEIKDNQEEDAWPQVIDIQNIIKIKPSSNDDSLRLDKQE